VESMNGMTRLRFIEAVEETDQAIGQE